MWAGTFVVRLGPTRSTLVAVQTDSAASLTRLRALFAAWLDDTMTAELADRSPAFRIHLAEPDGAGRGPRSVPHLRHGSLVLARSVRGEDVAHALAQVLGGIGADAPRAGTARVWLRLFTRGSQAVLVDAGRPHLLADRQLEAAGIHEVANWGIDLTRDGTLAPVGTLETLDWAAAGLAAPEPAPVLQLVGVAHLGEPESTGALVASLAAHSLQPGWFDALQAMSDQGLIRTAPSRAGLRSAVRALLVD